MKIHWMTIHKIIDENSEVKTYLLDAPQDFGWEEGAHTHFALKGFEEAGDSARELIRHMSISTSEDETSVGITTRIRDLPSRFKDELRNHKVGDQVALFKTISNVPLRRVDKNIYLLSSGVGLATLRPLVREYFKSDHHVNRMHSLNIDSSAEFLFSNVFNSAPEKKFTSEFVDSREKYYGKVRELATDPDGLFYIVGSDEFLLQNIGELRQHGVKNNQIMLDKYEEELPDFLPLHSQV